jgi:hypothetical protein
VNVRAAGTFHGSRLAGRATLSTFGPAGNKQSPDARVAFSGKRLAIVAP